MYFLFTLTCFFVEQNDLLVGLDLYLSSGVQCSASRLAWALGPGIHGLQQARRGVGLLQLPNWCIMLHVSQSSALVLRLVGLSLAFRLLLGTFGMRLIMQTVTMCVEV